MWLVDLYAEERLTDTLMAALAANHDTIHRVNSEGYNAYQIIYQFLLLPTDTQTKLHKSSEFNSWLFNVFGLKLNFPARILALVRNETWRDYTFRFCQTRYGEKMFAWSVIASIMSAKLDFVC